jgi:hypothetical protein
VCVYLRECVRVWVGARVFIRMCVYLRECVRVWVGGCARVYTKVNNVLSGFLTAVSN